MHRETEGRGQSSGYRRHADATNIIQAAKLYGFSLHTGFSVMVVLCCQLLGYGVDDLRSLAVIYDENPTTLTEQLISWGVLSPEARRAVEAV